MDGLRDIAGTGAPVLLLIAFLSLVSLTLICGKIIQLSGLRAGGAARRNALKRWADGAHRMAMSQVAAGRTPADRLLFHAFEGAEKRLPRQALNLDLERRGNAEIRTLSRGLRLLDIIAMIAPLLGLLGTIIGMIDAFRALEMAGGNATAAVLAGGIWQALITTAAGLIAAIPAAVGAQLLGARVDAIASDMEGVTAQFYVLEAAGQTIG